MPLYRINPAWINMKKEELKDTGHTEAICHNKQSAQALINLLLSENKAYKIYNLGAGIKRITTDTEKCPCCKQAI